MEGVPIDIGRGSNIDKFACKKKLAKKIKNSTKNDIKTWRILVLRGGAKEKARKKLRSKIRPGT